MSSRREDVLLAFNRLADRAARGEVPKDGYAVEPFGDGSGSAFLGSTAEGEFALLVNTERSSVPPPPVRLAGLSADFGILCSLSSGTEEKTLRLSSLRCNVTDRTVADLFGTVCAALVDALSHRPTEREFADEIGRWSSLFWRLNQRAETDVVGLAGELVVISEAPDCGVWLRAWHAEASDALDFAFLDSPVTVEVKSTRSPNREHIVSANQVSEPGLNHRYFASVNIELNDSGRSIGDVVRDLVDRAPTDEVRLGFWGALASTCGEGLEEVMSRRFNIEKAIISLRFYRAGDVPRPEIIEPLPQGVSSVKFTSNFALADEFPIARIDAAAQ